MNIFFIYIRNINNIDTKGISNIGYSIQLIYAVYQSSRVYIIVGVNNNNNSYINEISVVPIRKVLGVTIY